MRNPEHTLRAHMTLPLPVQHVFDFFAAAENLQVITPPELGFRIVSAGPAQIEQGALIDYQLGLFGLPVVDGYTSTIVSILFLGGVQLMSVGVLGEYIGRIYDEVKRRPLYLVRKLHGAASA